MPSASIPAAAAAVASAVSTAAPYIAAVSTVAQVFGTIGQGNASRATYDNQAAQLTQQAGQTRASAQRQEQNVLRQGAFAESRAQAVQAASGADPDSFTSVNNQTNLAGQTEYGALTALFNGEEKARGLDYESSNDYLKGSSAHEAGVISGVTQGLTGLSKFASPTTPTTADSGTTMYSNYTDPFNTRSNNGPYFQYGLNG